MRRFAHRFREIILLSGRLASEALIWRFAPWAFGICAWISGCLDLRDSPSILRSFLTYSVIGLSGLRNRLEERAAQLLSHIEAVSRSKLDVAFQTVSGLASELDGIEKEACFIIAGDIIYNMAHDVPRPERSTGKLVNGSDMDMVVLVSDDCPESYMNRLDEAIYREKHNLLLAPHLREELDYVVKPFSRVREQVRFDSFSHVLACKILQEGAFLYGNELLFSRG